ncbi:MarR family winged helix-turn-helix transcriptional regulator [Streptomyces griseocarneus]|uniref:MarR family winged helix-turn-helix transcriptional regulator n=1 Tax=Streptomyces griseocarneus TaxID=51201 RepID=UPI00198282B5|nr:MarR family transcriptional regulator [Streptomyces griseocarneus]MBZ6475396.1 MarR family transcriptional regulator [Streptomyces griseocarneus]GHG75052.1 MarR family transcriptional regulator [Streptomyces griseocarneus]
MSAENEALMALLPHMTRLSATLSRGQLFEKATASAGMVLDRPAVTILVILESAGRPLRVGEIATQMQVAGPHVTRHLNGLEHRDLIERVPDPDDQRARLITLTASGQELIDRYLKVIRGWFADALAPWSDRDQRDLVRLLGRMVEDLTVHLDAVVNDKGSTT